MKLPVFVVREESHLPGLFGVYVRGGDQRLASADSLHLAEELAASLCDVLRVHADAWDGVTIDA